MAGLTDIFGDIGGAVSDLYSAQGNKISASTYRKAAAYSDLNAGLEQYSTEIKLAQAQREAYLGIGREEAQIGNAGFTASGSATDLIRAAHEQAALQQGALTLQGTINVNAYKMQAEAERDQAASATVAQQGNMIGGLLKGIGAVAGIIGMIL